MSTLPNQQMPEAVVRQAAKIGLAIPAVCLPSPGVDLFRWPVIACDQFTAQPEYWQETTAIVGQSPSTLHMILPELYLEHPDGIPVADRISKINSVMRQYLADGTLRLMEPGWIVLDRATSCHPSRKGIVLAVDLDCYDFKPGNQELIRATEGTVLDRIPPRLAIRRDAPLEVPHVQLLIDDPGRTVIEPLLASLAAGEPVYQTRLMQDGGEVKAWLAKAGSPALSRALQALAELDSLKQHGLLCAVGDGNHSLATAKAHWENLRGQVAPDHPARYALVEMVNIHDAGLDFEPIHRVVFDFSPERFLAAAAEYFRGQDLTVSEYAAGQAAETAGGPDGQLIPLLWGDKRWLLHIGKPRHSLPAGSLQNFLDDLAARFPIRIDYIHGDDVVSQLAGQGQLGLLLPALDKNGFFATIAQDGILPRKTFSMGEAREKRYYFECRPIR